MAQSSDRPSEERRRQSTSMQPAEAQRKHGASMEPRRAGLAPVFGGRPATLVERLFEDMWDRMAGGFFGPRLLDELMGFHRDQGEGQWVPRLDVRDTGSEVVVMAELPGVDPKDVNIECTEDVLTLRGESREEHEEPEGAGYRGERRFFRQIALPPGLDLERAKASFRNGLLRIRVPRQEAAPEHVKRIPITSEGEQRAA